MLNGKQQLLILALIAVIGIGSSALFWYNHTASTSTNVLEKEIADKEIEVADLVNDLNKVKAEKAAEIEAQADEKAKIKEAPLDSQAINEINTNYLADRDLAANYNGAQVIVSATSDQMQQKMQASTKPGEEQTFMTDKITPELRMISEKHNNVTVVLINAKGESIIVIKEGKVDYRF
ncbi:hypothetical protein [Brochothrix thermosphacta]|uniref:hypothetical protein n=1 Tax=Brochothrix thermosphacta TaxID=2756 RepID=UPI000D790A95|nr:hypothetical protein [Brochothrix thermosphacta]SPN75344.1 hypothetical protein BTEBP_20143 [Brochothrix thermosphacta]